ncbi:MAG TPA: FtsX-like permease family protein, partial [Candidatus Krumholzibacterium sp.]|nr:FtsX-like permease family protein [Candidatus Krumholzibacterium sp.]
ESVLSHVASTHASLFPDELYETFFMDEEFDKQYRTDEQRARLFLLFAVFGIGIGCLGLFGLSSVLTQQRTKEVGVRKVFGATLYDICFLMSKEFLKWVVLSNIIAWPLAWLIMERFLRDFSTRIDIGPAPFVAAGAAALLVAALTVSYQSIRAGLTDPADSLKYE